MPELIPGHTGWNHEHNQPSREVMMAERTTMDDIAHQLTHFTNPLGTAGRVYSYRKHQRMPNPISYTRLRTPLSYNMHLLDGITLTEHGMPIINPYDGPAPEHMMGFNELLSLKPAERHTPPAHTFSSTTTNSRAVGTGPNSTRRS